MSRSFVKNPSPDAIHVLRQALVLKSIPRDPGRPGLQECYVMGWLHSEAVDISASQVVLVYPTRLHAKWVTFSDLLWNTANKISSIIYRFMERYYTTSTGPFSIKKIPIFERFVQKSYDGSRLGSLSRTLISSPPALFAALLNPSTKMNSIELCTRF